MAHWVGFTWPNGILFVCPTFTTRPDHDRSWWRHQMETFSALLAFYERNSPAIGGFPSQRPVKRSFNVFFDLRLNKRLSKPSRRRRFYTPSRSLWHHCNEYFLRPIWMCRGGTLKFTKYSLSFAERFSMSWHHHEIRNFSHPSYNSMYQFANSPYHIRL